MKFICTYCESTKYNLVDGWYYCNECHRQNFQELELDAFAFGGDGALKKTKIKDVSMRERIVKDQQELTTWEGFNYILRGLTNELLQLGVNPNIELTVFQLWTAYLTKTEIAFFDIEKPALPKLPPSFKKRDADILYNHHRRIRKTKPRKSRASTTITSRGKKLKLSKLVELSQRSENESILEHERSDLNRTLTSLADLSVSEIQSMTTAKSISSASSLSLDYSRIARQSFRSWMPKNHIKVHANDFDGSVKCHKIGRDKISSKYQNRMLARDNLFVFLYLALNHHRELIQIGDVIRFCRESHLSYATAEHFFPQNMNEKNINEINGIYTRMLFHHTPQRVHFEKRVLDMMELISYELEEPDLNELVERYVTDLQLPTEMIEILEKFMTIYPHQMELHQTKRFLPSYEGRAMAYILFLLKLIFCLDDSTEKEMSKSARVINQVLKGSGHELFVWDEWVEYIEARKNLISKVHPPSYFQSKRETDASSTEKFIHKIKPKTFINDEDELMDTIDEKHMQDAHKPTVRRREDMKEIAKNIVEAHEPSKSILTDFPPSLTPSTTYMEIIRESYSHEVHILSLLLREHKTRSINFLLEPMDLKNLLQNQKIKLCTNEAKFNPNVKFVRWSGRKKVPVFLKVKEVDFNIDSPTWQESIYEDQRLDREYVENDTAEYHEKRKKKYEWLWKKGPSEEETDVKPLENDNFNMQITMKIPHFFYWMNVYHTETYWQGAMKNDCEDTFKELPQSFMWLLRHLSERIEMKPSQLYRELLIIETQFMYVMKPLNKIRKNGWPKVREREIGFRLKQMRNVIDNFSNHF